MLDSLKRHFSLAAETGKIPATEIGLQFFVEAEINDSLGVLGLMLTLE